MNLTRDNGTVLYDVLLQNTDAQLVNMELDLGWVIAQRQGSTGLFRKVPKKISALGTIKDMNLKSKESTEVWQRSFKH